MDFGSLLHKAQKNGQTQKKEIRYYSTKFEPPKKEQRSKELSANIKKFLARKEQEEKQKLEEARQKKEELMALRAQDKKATRTMNVMLKRTKSANQSVLQDAIDNDNTAVTLAGPLQPDEDDYGYVSQEASAFYQKMMEKYSKMPDEKKYDFTKKKVDTNLKSTKDRVKAALDKEKEDAMLPHKRKRKHKDTDGSYRDEDKYDKYTPESESNKPKPKPKPAPPPLNFAELLKIAEKKQFEPIVIEQKTKEEERLFTKKQKREAELERAYRERKEMREKEGKMGVIPKKPKLEDKTNTKLNGDRIPKLNGDKGDVKKLNGDKGDVKKSSAKIPEKTPTNALPKPSDRDRAPILSKTLTNGSSKLPSRPSSSPNLKPASQTMKNGLDKRKEMMMKGRPISKDTPSQSASKGDLKAKKPPPPDLKPRKFPPEDVRPLKDPKPKSRIPPPDMSRFPMKKKPPVNRGRMVLDDDDSEYDSEMDDFIDDGPEENNDYSKYISEIFGYDKSRYRDIDDDVDNMESSFAQQMKEEAISKKIGIQEDLEDMRMEEEEKRRKALMKKRRR